MANKPDWLAVDWGTTHLRVWLMSADGKVIERRDSDQGMSRLTPDQFDQTLMNIVGDIARPGLAAIVCGMAGARQGWSEAPYCAVPCPPPGADQAKRAPSEQLDVSILPGVSQASPADVMRGEETQIAGFLARDPEFDGVLCLPGTHTKWVHISAGEIVSFRTFMTGEMFGLLSKQSVLRHSVTTDAWSQAAFDETLADTLSRPADLAAKLFSLRAEGLLDDLDPAAARARLSALLIGAELAAAKPYWLGQQVVVLGDGSLCAAYQAALAKQGVSASAISVEGLTLAGLTAAYETLKGI